MEQYEHLANTTVAKKTAIGFFGSDKLKKQFEKYGKIKNPDSEAALIKEMERYYDSVEKVKVGRSVQYKLGNLRQEISDKVDGRITNGHTAMSYKTNLDVIVAGTLMTENLKASNTMARWLNIFGFIDDFTYDVVTSRVEDGSRDRVIKKLQNQYDVSLDRNYTLDDYIMLTRDLQGHLESSLKRMAKKGIIEFYEVQKAKLDDGSYIQLHDETYKHIVRTKMQLADKHGLKPWMANVSYVNKEEYKEAHEAFKDEFSKFLMNDVKQAFKSDREPEKIKIKFYWKAHAIFIKQTDEAVLKYLQTYNKEAIDFYQDNKKEFIKDNVLTYEDKRSEVVKNKIHEKAYDKYPVTLRTENIDGFGKTATLNKVDTNSHMRDLYMKTMHDLENIFGSDFKSLIEHKLRD